MSSSQSASQSAVNRQQMLQEMWTEYKKTGSESLRNQLMEMYMPVVRMVAERMRTRLPEGLDVDDLISDGVFGLASAIDGFDLDRGCKFETYCVPRVRGAMLDGLRAMDWVPRLVRSRTARVEQTRRSLEMQNGRKPSDEELADALGVEEEEYVRIRKDSNATQTMSLSHTWTQQDSGRDVSEIDILKDNRQLDPARAVLKRDMRDVLTKQLSRAERLIIILYYYEQLTMKEIGQTLDLSESRVSQMHSSILARLKAQMQHRVEDLLPEKE